MSTPPIAGKTDLNFQFCVCNGMLTPVVDLLVVTVIYVSVSFNCMEPGILRLLTDIE